MPTYTTIPVRPAALSNEVAYFGRREIFLGERYAHNHFLPFQHKGKDFSGEVFRYDTPNCAYHISAIPQGELFEVRWLYSSRDNFDVGKFAINFSRGEVNIISRSVEGLRMEREYVPPSHPWDRIVDLNGNPIGIPRPAFSFPVDISQLLD